MYKTPKFTKTDLEVNQSYEGETIEQKIERITVNKEQIKDSAPIIYTERNEGVKPGYNIKTDRFEIAVDAMDRVTRSAIAKRDNKPKLEVVKDSGAESIQGTNGTNN